MAPPTRHSIPVPAPVPSPSASWRGSTDSGRSFAERAAQRHSSGKTMSPQKPTIIIPPPSRAGGLPVSSSPERSFSATTGQSRFLEGSMNDRVSAVPPAVFLSGEEEIGRFERQFYAPLPSPSPSAPGFGSGYFGNSGGYEKHGHVRSRSSVQGIGSSFMSSGGVSKKFSLAPLWDGVKEKLSLRSSRSSGSIITSFVHRREQSHSSNNSGSSGSSSYHRQLQQQSREVEPPQEGGGSPTKEKERKDTTGYPGREEVLESYKNLQASGFFSNHAIKGTRHPLRTAASAPLGMTASSGSGSAGRVMGPPPALPITAGDRRSFAERLAAANEQHYLQQQQQQQLKPASSFSNTNAHVTTPQKLKRQQHQQPPPGHHLLSPVPPPRTTSLAPPPLVAGSSSPASSPGSRGTKRSSQDIGGEAETATRKLVKKLRRSTSRASFSGSSDKNYSNGVHSRPSTAVGNYTTTTESVGSSFSEEYHTPHQQQHQQPPSPQRQQASPTKKLGLGKLTKAMPTKDGKKRNLLGLRRRNNIFFSSAPTPAAPAAPVIQEQEEENHYTCDEFMAERREEEEDIDMIDASLPSLPPAVENHWREKPQHQGHHYHYPQRLRTVSGNSAHSAASSSSKMSVDSEPLCVVPDPNRGIPSVPRIPRALLYAGKPVVVDIDEERRVKREERERVRKSRESLLAAAAFAGVAEAAGGKRREQRDSGLGEDVENIPVW